MTLVAAMRFNQKEGAMIADQQVGLNADLHTIAHTDVKVATHTLENVSIILGEAGISSVTYAIFDRIAVRLKENSQIKDAKKVARLIARTAIDYKLEWIRDYLEAEGIGGLAKREDGPIPSKEETEKKYKECIDFQEPVVKNRFASSSLMALVTDSQDTFINRFTFINSHPLRSSRPFEVIGAGEVIAVPRLADFIETIPVEKRQDIPPMQGLTELLNAYASARQRQNIVGNIPTLYAIRGRKMYAPGQNNCLTALNLARAGSEGFVKERHVTEGIQQLVYENEKWEKIEDAMMQAAGKKHKKLTRFLLGYVE